MDHFPYLFAAYAVVWAVIVFYVWTLDRRSRRTEKQIEELEKRMRGR